MTALVITLTTAAVLTASYFINASDDSDRCAEAIAAMNMQVKKA